MAIQKPRKHTECKLPTNFPNGMVPLADLFNHKTAAEDVHIVNDSDSDSDLDSHKPPKVPSTRNHVKEVKRDPSQTEECSGMSSPELEGNSNVLEMILVKEVTAAGEIFSTYGTLSNAALLHRCGFTEVDNPFDIVNIDWKLVFNCVQSLFQGVTSVTGELFGDEAFDQFCNLDNNQGMESTARTFGWTGPAKPVPAARGKKRGRQTKQVQRGDTKVDLESWLLTAPVGRGMHKLLEMRDSLYPSVSLEADLAQLSTNFTY
ncbi:unnamed protein product [Calypogeia fissa]